MGRAILGIGRALGKTNLWLIILISVCLLPALLKLYRHLTFFEDAYFDGVLQLFNTLRRIEAGHVVGRDYFAFHGPGLAYLFYPLYRLFGGELWGAQTSIYLVCFGANLLVLYLLVRHSVPLERQLWVLACLALALYFPLANLWRSTVYSSFPQSSYLGLRGAIWPIVAAIILALRGRPYQHFIAAMAAGVAIWLSVDQAVTGVLVGLPALGIAYLTHLWRPTRQQFVQLVGGLLIGTSLFIILSGIGPSEIRRLIEYHFHSQTSDQFWFWNTSLGGYANQRSVSGYFLFLLRHSWSSVVVAVWSIFMISRSSGYRIERFVLLALLVQALVFFILTSLTYQYASEASLIRITLVLLAFELSLLIKHQLKFLLVGSCCLLAVSADHMPRLGQVFDEDRLRQLVTVRANRDQADRWLVYNQTIARYPEQSWWSEFEGLPAAERNAFNASGFDNLYHALGHENRLHYKAALLKAQPDIIETTNYWYLAPYYWDTFFDYVISNYEPVDSTFWSVIWRRSVAPVAVFRPAGYQWNAAAKQLYLQRPDSIDTSVPLLWEVQVNYKTIVNKGLASLSGKLDRVMVVGSDAANQKPWALDPSQNRQTFAVWQSAQNRTDTITFSALKPFGYTSDSFEISRLQVRCWPVPEKNRALYQGLMRLNWDRLN